MSSAISQSAIIRRQSNPAQQPLSCQVYSLPAANDIITAYELATLRWDPNCLKDEKSIDIYLQSIDAGQPVHVWKSITTSSGKLETRFIPDWWNSTSDSSFQLLITGSDLPAWAGHGPGPTFHVHFDGNIPSSVGIRPKGASSQVGGISVEVINGISHHSHGLTGGRLGAAIFMPIIAVVVSIIVYVLISRKRTGEASKRWSQYVDQRMSMVGGSDWDLAAPNTLRSIPRSRAESIIRHSASLPPRPLSQLNPRASVYSSDPSRPGSTAEFMLSPTQLKGVFSGHSRSKSQSLATSDTADPLPGYRPAIVPTIQQRPGVPVILGLRLGQFMNQGLAQP
ncbi:hypothetical protein BY996DRAFT_8693148 [Phakopsora pachyrhizi]|nr:hypothetical protein BY996DRAFT_8693148 [Phakopsora pachyrhizi]